MSYFEWPEYYTDHHFNWEHMKSHNARTDDLASIYAALLLYDLGRVENLDIDYGLESSGGYYYNVPRTFKNYGYIPPTWRSFSEADLIRNLRNYIPVILGAGGIKKPANTSSNHAWVVDGYKIHKLNDLADDKTYRTTDYYHCRWGWGGTEDDGDGFFRINGSVNVTAHGNTYTYNKDMKILGDFIPLKD